ncbi:serine hydrolase domain-containing protein [Streptomyces sp. NPDC127106]|uniref:serine hydrolase domain-containing protein n=1 Tax=Streptomyces sp. NPDC127106 TaxID=3345360 RepID=UPI0036443B54
MTQDSRLNEFVAAAAEKFDVPGVSVGVLVDGRESYASHGVTSLEHPLPMDERTLFPIASATKTFTATALMRLAAEGRVDLDAPVRRYVPELELADEETAATVTVMNLLNHTSGLSWNVIDTAGEDETLAGFVARLSRLELIAAPGERASYSQAAYNLAGRVVEKVTEMPFEKAVASLVLEPVGLSDTFFDLDDVVTRKFALGYNRGEDGGLRVATPWKAYRGGSRGNNPGGGGISSAGDLLRWARFHLGDGDGVLPAEALRRMQEQTVEVRGSSLADGFGIGWFLREVDGVRVIKLGGSGNGQFSELLIVPERNFALVSLANCGPDGHPFNQSVVRWALEHYLGVIEREPEPVPYDDARAREVAGRYENDAMNIDIAADGARLTLAAEIKPEIRAASEAGMPPDYAPAGMGLLAGGGDEYVITGGGLQGERGFFSRDENGAVVGIDLAGRLFTRTQAAPAAP